MQNSEQHKKFLKAARLDKAVKEASLRRVHARNPKTHEEWGSERSRYMISKMMNRSDDVPRPPPARRRYIPR
jgi:hypothetical protein